MNALRSIVVAAACAFWPQASPVAADGPREAIKLEVLALPDFERHLALLPQPGYMAIALENNGLSPSMSSKLKIDDGGRSVEIRMAVLSYVGVKGSEYAYEAGIKLGIGDTKLTFPVSVDTGALKSGKVTVTLSPPLAGMIPVEITDRIRLKVQLIANPRAQKLMLDYLDTLAARARPAGAGEALQKAILLDAYNKSGGPERPGSRDTGDAVPLSEQWLLLLTLAIWLIVVPLVLVVLRLRSRAARA